MIKIIHGIIIEALSDLRDQKQRNEYDRKNVEISSKKLGKMNFININCLL